MVAVEFGVADVVVVVVFRGLGLVVVDDLRLVSGLEIGEGSLGRCPIHEPPRLSRLRRLLLLVELVVAVVPAVVDVDWTGDGADDGNVAVDVGGGVESDAEVLGMDV